MAIIKMLAMENGYMPTDPISFYGQEVAIESIRDIIQGLFLMKDLKPEESKEEKEKIKIFAQENSMIIFQHGKIYLRRIVHKCSGQEINLLS